jgi:hypothetical protein
MNADGCNTILWGDAVVMLALRSQTDFDTVGRLMALLTCDIGKVRTMPCKVFNHFRHLKFARVISTNLDASIQQISQIAF